MSASRFVNTGNPPVFPSLMTPWLKEATAAGTGLCGVSETTSESGPSPANVLALTQKLYGWFWFSPRTENAVLGGYTS